MLPIANVITPNIHARPVWNNTACHILFVEPSSLLIAPIAPKQGAENKLNTINAYALAPLKNPNIEPVPNIKPPSVTSSARPAMIAILDTTCSFATKPCIADTLAAQLHSPNIG